MISRREIGDFSARNRREISKIHTTMISRRFLAEKSLISRRDVAANLSGPTERHVTSHVIDLDICEFLIMDTRRWRRLMDCIAIKFVVTLVGSIACTWATDSYRYIRETWVLQKTTFVDEGLLYILYIGTLSYARMLCWYNAGASCIWWSGIHEFHPHEQRNVWHPLGIGEHKTRNCVWWFHRRWNEPQPYV